MRTRDLQRETGGFTEFVPLPFVHMATPIYLQRRARRGPTFRETLLMHAVGRIAYRGAIDNIQVSWVKMGVDGARQLLQAGVNDLGGTLMDENISRAAGAQHGQMMDVDELDAIVAPLGRPLAQRTTLYGWRARPAGARPTTAPHSTPKPTPRRRTAERGRGAVRAALALARAQARELYAMLGTRGPGTRGHRGHRPQDGRRRPGRDGRGLPGLPALPPHRKVTIFGSARTQPDDPVYVLGPRPGGSLAAADWMVVTGAGPGIMAAGMEGAGRDHSIGVNIRLPYEQGANAFIAQDPKLVEMRYFFTRKLMLIKESRRLRRAARRLRHPRRGLRAADPAADRQGRAGARGLLDIPGGTYWQAWKQFLDDRGRAPGPGLARRPRAVHGHRRRGRGHRRAARLLPQLPLVPVGRRPARHAAAGGPRARPS